jgi:hypothetical protein
MEEKKGILLRKLPVEVHRDLKILAIHQDKTLQQLVIDILSDYVAREMGRKDAGKNVRS